MEQSHAEVLGSLGNLVNSQYRAHNLLILGGGYARPAGETVSRLVSPATSTVVASRITNVMVPYTEYSYSIIYLKYTANDCGQ